MDSAHPKFCSLLTCKYILVFLLLEGPRSCYVQRESMKGTKGAQADVTLMFAALKSCWFSAWWRNELSVR